MGLNLNGLERCMCGRITKTVGKLLGIEAAFGDQYYNAVKNVTYSGGHHYTAILPGFRIGEADRSKSKWTKRTEIAGARHRKQQRLRKLVPLFHHASPGDELPLCSDTAAHVFARYSGRRQKLHQPCLHHAIEVRASQDDNALETASGRG